MRVFDEWIDEGAGARASPGWMTGRPFAVVPSIVAPRLNAIHLLDQALSHVAEPQFSGDAVEAEAPGVAQPVGIDLRSSAGAVRERICRGYPVRRSRRVHVDAEHLAEQDVRALTIVQWVAGAAAVTHAEVEQAVRPEDDA